MGKGPDVRWVGNEGGVGRTTEWSVIPLPTSPDKFNWPDMQGGDLGSRRPAHARFASLVVSGGSERHHSPEQPMVLGAATNIRAVCHAIGGHLLHVRRPQRKSHPESVARHARPDSRRPARGVEPDGADHQRNVRHRPRRRRQSHGRQFQPCQRPVAGAGRKSRHLVGSRAGQDQRHSDLTLPKAVTFDVVSLQEAVDHRGQRIESFAIEAWNGSAWVAAEKMSSDDLTTVGHRRLIRLKSPVTTARCACASRVRASNRRSPKWDSSSNPSRPCRRPFRIVHQRLVSDQQPGGNKMVYTCGWQRADDQLGGLHRRPSNVAVDPASRFAAASVLPNGKLGIEGSRTFAGFMPDRLESGQLWTARKPPGRTTPPPARLTAIRPPSGTRVGTPTRTSHISSPWTWARHITSVDSPICRARMDCSMAWLKIPFRDERRRRDLDDEHRRWLVRQHPKQSVASGSEL
jgi:alpha-L-fucosidase